MKDGKIQSELKAKKKKENCKCVKCRGSEIYSVMARDCKLIVNANSYSVSIDHRIYSMIVGL